ncbi:MAG: hypothetical protein Q7N50_01175 [Armatimonadota bacterium]|nr:hypothetical protein [Armatimonadota bacterium]
MPTHSLGGAPFLYDPGPKTGQMGTKAWIRENGGVLTDLMGLNNVGLFVTVCGKVTGTVTGYFFMDDGSGFDDGDPAKSGIKVALPTGVSAPAIDTYVVVTGISSSYKTSPLSSDVFRLLRPRQASDIIPLDP